MTDPLWPLAIVRERIASRVKKHPDSSHGEGYVNRGLETALTLIDFAMDVPCRPRPRLGNSPPDDLWCELHHSPMRPADSRCSGHQYVREQAL